MRHKLIILLLLISLLASFSQGLTTVEFDPRTECIKLIDYLLSIQETSFLDYCKLAGEYCKHTLFPEWCSWFFITNENAIFNVVINKENPEKICWLAD